MDPHANIERQRALAKEIIDRGNTLASHEDGKPRWAVWDAANELAEQVQALDEWRAKGGFDPYVPETRGDGEDDMDASDWLLAIHQTMFPDQYPREVQPQHIYWLQHSDDEPDGAHPWEWDAGIGPLVAELLALALEGEPRANLDGEAPTSVPS